MTPCLASTARRSLAAAILVVFGAQASAEMRVLAAPGDWPAVGRLNIAGQGHCTAALIAPDIALTAAHCLGNRLTGADWRPERLHFLPGWHLGKATDHLRGEVVARPEGWRGAVPSGPRGYVAWSDIVADIALIRLDAAASVPPLASGTAPAAVGDRVRVVSYGRDRAQVASVQSDCGIIERQGDVLVTDCEAVPGVSGAPLLREGAAGVEVIGVVSTRVARRAEPAGPALAVALDAHLPALRAMLAGGR